MMNLAKLKEQYEYTLTATCKPTPLEKMIRERAREGLALITRMEAAEKLLKALGVRSSGDDLVCAPDWIGTKEYDTWKAAGGGE